MGKPRSLEPWNEVADAGCCFQLLRDVRAVQRRDNAGAGARTRRIQHSSRNKRRGRYYGDLHPSLGSVSDDTRTQHLVPQLLNCCISVQEAVTALEALSKKPNIKLVVFSNGMYL